MQANLLKQIHSSHHRIEKCKHRARDIVFWPGMNKQIDLNAKLVAHTREAISKSHCYHMKSPSAHGLEIHYSGFIEVEHLHETTSNKIVDICKSQFAHHGIPDTLITDNGPQFSSNTFKNFADQYQFKHVTSSPLYPCTIKWQS